MIRIPPWFCTTCIYYFLLLGLIVRLLPMPILLEHVLRLGAGGTKPTYGGSLKNGAEEHSVPTASAGAFFCTITNYTRNLFSLIQYDKPCT